MNDLNEIRKNIGAFFYKQSIGNKFSRFIYLDEKDYTERFLASVKYVDNFNGCSLIPNKNKGDKFQQKYPNIKNTFIYEDEARNTPCALYCWGCVSKDRIFYKIGITATRHAVDDSHLGLIQYRMNCTEENFYRKGNGTLKIYPLFIIKSSYFNCQILENTMHRNSVFNGSIEKEFKYFSGITECCRYLDLDHLDKLKNEIHMLDEYEWIDSIYLKKINRKENDKIVSAFHMFEYLEFLQDWICLANLNQIPKSI